MGIRGSLKANYSVSATYFSNYFTLANMTGSGDEMAAKLKASESPASSNKFPTWAIIVILGTTVLSLCLSWGCLCYRMKRKQINAAQNRDCEMAAEKWYGSPNTVLKNGRVAKPTPGRSVTSPAIQQMSSLTGGPRRPPRPRSTTLSGNLMFELDASEIQKPPNVWRESWHTVRGFVVGGRAELRASRSDVESPILPRVPIPKGASIGRRNEVRWKPSYPGT